MRTRATVQHPFVVRVDIFKRDSDRLVGLGVGGIGIGNSENDGGNVRAVGDFDCPFVGRNLGCRRNTPLDENRGVGVLSGHDGQVDVFAFLPGSDIARRCETESFFHGLRIVANDVDGMRRPQAYIPSLRLAGEIIKKKGDTLVGFILVVVHGRDHKTRRRLPRSERQNTVGIIVPADDVVVGFVRTAGSSLLDGNGNCPRVGGGYRLTDVECDGCRCPPVLPDFRAAIRIKRNRIFVGFDADGETVCISFNLPTVRETCCGLRDGDGVFLLQFSSAVSQGFDVERNIPARMGLPRGD